MSDGESVIGKVAPAHDSFSYTEARVRWVRERHIGRAIL